MDMQKEPMPKAALMDNPDAWIEVGEDNFMDHGRYMLFFELLRVTAKDMCLPSTHSARLDAERWLADSDNMAAMCVMLDGAAEVGPAISRAVLERPEAVCEACDSFLRSIKTSGGDITFDRFREAIGAPTRRGASSLVGIEDDISVDSESM